MSLQFKRIALNNKLENLSTEDKEKFIQIRENLTRDKGLGEVYEIAIESVLIDFQLQQTLKEIAELKEDIVNI